MLLICGILINMANVVYIEPTSRGGSYVQFQGYSISLACPMQKVYEVVSADAVANAQFQEKLARAQAGEKK